MKWSLFVVGALLFLLAATIENTVGWAAGRFLNGIVHRNEPASDQADIDFKKALADLGSKDQEARTVAVDKLRDFLADAHAPALQQRQVLDGLARFVRLSAPTLPPNSRRAAYCDQDAFAHAAAGDVQSALEAIGRRDNSQKALSVDLTRVNLAYANLQDFNLRNVQFDGSLLCRSFLRRSKFEGASFFDADLRYTSLTDASGLTAESLADCSSLYLSVLPAEIRRDHRLIALRGTDPDAEKKPLP